MHIRNIRDKSDTFTVEDVNADLRHSIPLLARQSRCFPRKLETLRAVVDVFVDAYNDLAGPSTNTAAHMPQGNPLLLSWIFCRRAVRHSRLSAPTKEQKGSDNNSNEFTHRFLHPEL